MANSTYRHLFANTIDGQYSVRNYIRNAFARENTSGYATYANTAQATPVSGTGGSPTIAFTRNTSSPLRFEADFELANSGSNFQGQGVSYDFTLDTADLNKVISFSFDYKVGGAFVTGGTSDVQIFIYDITNSQLLQIPRNAILSNQGFFTGTFQANSSTSYRIIFHVATTNASAWTINFTNLQINTISFSGSGPIISDWQIYTPVISASFGSSTTLAYYRRSGDSVEIRVDISSGTLTAAPGIIGLPSGLSIDSSKLTTSSSVGSGTDVVGFWGSDNTLNNSSGGGILAYASDLANVYMGGNWFTFSNRSINLNNFTSTTEFNINFRVPILGWGSNTATVNSGILQISSVLVNGTRVTGSAPTKLGQYRSYLRNASANTYTETNGTPGTLPSVLNGIEIWGSNAWGTADASNQPSRYDIYVGTNKSIKVQIYTNTGRTSPNAFNTSTYIVESPTSLVSGMPYDYDPTTGILSIYQYANAAGGLMYLGQDITGSLLNTLYFDIIVADNDFQIQLASTASELLFFDSSGYGSSGTKIIKFASIAKQIGSTFTYVPDSTNGDSILINEPSIVCIDFSQDTITASSMGISLNSNQLSTSITGITAANKLGWCSIPSGNLAASISVTLHLNTGDVIRGHTDGVIASTFVRFRLTKIG